MAKYEVGVVITGTVDVEAENDQDAKREALEAVDHLPFCSLSNIKTCIGCVEDDNRSERGGVLIWM